MSLYLKNITYTYHPGTPYARSALKDICMDLQQHDVLGIMGETGSGKSTLLQIIAGLLPVSQGNIIVDGTDIKSDSGKLGFNIHKKIGIVFQNPEEQIFQKTVYDEIAFGLKKQHIAENQVADKVRHILSEFGLDASYDYRVTHTLSSGEKRRVAIASILVLEPDYLLFDEPTSGLDFEGRAILFEYLQKEKRKKNGIIIASHNPNDLFAVCNRFLLLRNGAIMFCGDRQEWVRNYHKLSDFGMLFPEFIQVLHGLKLRGWKIHEEHANFAEAVQEIVSYSLNIKK